MLAIHGYALTRAVSKLVDPTEHAKQVERRKIRAYKGYIEKYADNTNHVWQSRLVQAVAKL
jgi:retron-type reverse transcriptase